MRGMAIVVDLLMATTLQRKELEVVVYISQVKPSRRPLRRGSGTNIGWYRVGALGWQRYEVHHRAVVPVPWLSLDLLL